jgi:hypothetical protein
LVVKPSKDIKDLGKKAKARLEEENLAEAARDCNARFDAF